MSENKFTPGPWMVSGNGIATKNCKQVCRKPINADKTIVGKCWTCNANLIAAAPELLEALEAWKSAEEYGNKYNHLKDAQEEIAAAWEHAEELRDKAIAKAKAKGESNV